MSDFLKTLLLLCLVLVDGNLIPNSFAKEHKNLSAIRSCAPQQKKFEGSDEKVKSSELAEEPGDDEDLEILKRHLKEDLLAWKESETTLGLPHGRDAYNIAKDRYNFSKMEYESKKRSRNEMVSKIQKLKKNRQSFARDLIDCLRKLGKDAEAKELERQFPGSQS